MEELGDGREGKTKTVEREALEGTLAGRTSETDLMASHL